MPTQRESEKPSFKITIGGAISQPPAGRPYSTQHHAHSLLDPGIHGMIEIMEGNVYFYPASAHYSFVGYLKGGKKEEGNPKVELTYQNNFTPDNFKDTILSKRIGGMLMARIWRGSDRKIKMSENPLLIFKRFEGKTEIYLQDLLKEIGATHKIPENVLGRSERSPEEQKKTERLNIFGGILRRFGRSKN